MSESIERAYYAQQIAQWGIHHPQAVGCNRDRDTAVQVQATLLNRAILGHDDERVLDVGCGNLITRDALFKLGVKPKNYHGLDIMPEFVEYALAQGTNVRLTPKAGPLWPQANRFDVAVTVGTFLFFRNREQINALWQRMIAAAHCAVFVFRIMPMTEAVPNLNHLLEDLEAYNSRLTIANEYCVGSIWRRA